MYTSLLLLPLLVCLNNPMVMLPDSDCEAESLLPSYPMQVVYTGDCDNYEASGTGKAEWQINGQKVIQYEGQFADGLPNGKGKATLFGATFDGEWEEGLPVKGKTTYSESPVFLRKRDKIITLPVPDSTEFIQVDKEAEVDIRAIQRHLEYPDWAQKRGIKGRMFVRALIGTDGTIQAVGILECSHPVFILPTMDAILQTTCVPAEQDGQPIEMWIVMPIIFSF